MKSIKIIVLCFLIVASCSIDKNNVETDTIVKDQNNTVVINSIEKENDSFLSLDSLKQKGYYIDNSRIEKNTGFDTLGNVLYFADFFENESDFKSYDWSSLDKIFNSDKKVIANVYRFKFSNEKTAKNWFDQIQEASPLKLMRFYKPKKIMILAKKNVIVIETYRLKKKEILWIVSKIKNIESIYSTYKEHSIISNNK